MAESAGIVTLADIIAGHAQRQGARAAVQQDGIVLSYEDLHTLAARIAAGLQRDQVAQRSSVSIVSATKISAVAVFVGALAGGFVPTPIAPSSTPDQLSGMIANSGASVVFADDHILKILADLGLSQKLISLDKLEQWLPPSGTVPTRVQILPDDPFNIIYSSGTTGVPKGIVHSHAMRLNQIAGFAPLQLSDAVTAVSTPLYSNTTLVSLLPTLSYGGTVLLIGKFDARSFLETAERERVTHAMLVPVQYQRIMAVRDFDSFDLSSFRVKMCTSAPFPAELKADVLRRWPGALLEIYGMTEGGGFCLLFADQFPDKLHTVGVPAPGNDVRIINEAGQEVAKGDIGEVVGRSSVMMAGYHGRATETSAAEWVSPDGLRFIRHGDLGRFDADGFLVLHGRSKDMIISGGFNIYPADIEAVLLTHPAITDAAVVGVPSQTWGESPYAFCVCSDPKVTGMEIVEWARSRTGKYQRLSGANLIGELPRSAIGKVLKGDLLEQYRSNRPAGSS